MIDIGEKASTLRIAVARAVLLVPATVVQMIKDRSLEKGDALEIARAAAILGAKRTWELLPLCHPLLIERHNLEYNLLNDRIVITVEVATHAKTGVEMEALTAASICALTLYDMLKPHGGTDLAIQDIILTRKTGGKSNFERKEL